MDRWKYFDITHRNHTFMNPSSEEKLDWIIGLLQLPAGARVLDIACGKADPLLRIGNRHDIHGTGVDLSPFCITAARERLQHCTNPASQFDLLLMDGRQFQSDQPFDLAICLGASWVYDGFAGTLAHMATVVKPGGLVLVGEPYWRKSPAPEYLEAIGARAEDYSTYVGNVELGIAAGLTPLYALDSSLDEWDRYEWMQTNAAERYALEQPGDPDVPELLAQVRAGRDQYLKWGRDTFGWSMYLFVKP